jgi:hypothetical protein
MKTRDTVSNLLENDRLVRDLNDVLLACAMELGDSVSQEVIAAHRTLGSISLDAEHEFDAAVAARDLAERRFLAVHAETEVTL